MTPDPGPAVAEALQTVIVVSSRDPGRQDELTAAEAAIVADAVPARRSEFAAGRSCARTAMRQLGFEVVELLTEPDRTPRWPAAVSGSITHCRGLAAAAVLPRTHGVSIGVDAEPNEPLEDGLVDQIASAGERRRLARTVPASVAWQRLVFCIKEAAFKGWWDATTPQRRRILEFSEMTVTVIDAAVTSSVGVTGGRFATEAFDGTIVHGRWQGGADEQHLVVLAATPTHWTLPVSRPEPWPSDR